MSMNSAWTTWTCPDPNCLCRSFVAPAPSPVPALPSATYQQIQDAVNRAAQYASMYGGAMDLEWLVSEPLPIAEQDGVITGWRVWYAIPLGNVTVLRSAYRDSLWPVGSPMEAHALNQSGSESGIHAFTSREAACASRYVQDLSKKPLFGTVALWGRVIEHEKGYRAQYAYPQKLYVPYGVEDQASLAKSVAKTYGCEVEIEPAPSEAA